MIDFVAIWILGCTWTTNKCRIKVWLVVVQTFIFQIKIFTELLHYLLQFNPYFQRFLRLRLQYFFHLSLLKFKIAMLFLLFFFFEQSEIMAAIIWIAHFAVSLRRYTKVLTTAKKENQKSINWYQSSSESVKLETKILWKVELSKMFCTDHAPIEQ